jgi:hypothetical protein
MLTRFRHFVLTLGFLAATLALHGAEKNGLQVTVAKTTLDRSDQRPGYYYSTRIDRTQGLKVSVKNMSFQPKPEGVVEWQILVQKYYSSDVESTKGTEKLQALRGSETTELIIGSANIKGWRDSFDNVKDKLEWQVIIKHDGKETIKLNSTSGFDALAKRAGRS